MKEYEVIIGGLRHTLQLTDEDAQRIGATPVEVKQAPKPANKSRRAANKARE